MQWGNLTLLGGICLLVCLCIAPAALAADSGAGGREIYDLVMRWINFIILVLLLIKFLKTPLKTLLGSHKEKLAREIERVEAQKAEVEAKIAETEAEIAFAEERLQQIKERIIRQGEQKKQQIIEEARQQSRFMLQEAQRRLSNQIAGARRTLRDELVEAAMDKAMARLPQLVTPEDNQKLVQRFIAAAGK